MLLYYAKRYTNHWTFIALNKAKVSEHPFREPLVRFTSHNIQLGITIGRKALPLDHYGQKIPRAF